MPNTESAANFIKANNIHEPIFNDFDIGSYLIYHLYAGKDSPHVFADGRPEAYPRGFLGGPYLHLFSDEAVWREQNEKYHFNAIVISLGDAVAEDFILHRVRDDEWAPVFADNYALIFVRRTPENAELIAKDEIPRNRFR
ncbi:MAG: hypothetical protein WDO18_23035 [Acidobacteriota bacterium]